MKTYKPRIADKELQRKLAGIGAVLIEGPKWCIKPRPLSNRENSPIDVQTEFM